MMLSQIGPVQVVRKQLRFGKNERKESYDRMFFEELKCLTYLDRLAHPNIIRLLGSYTYGGRHNFLFPCYETDLRDFLKSESRLGDFRLNITFFSALRGLASALCSTHNLHLEKEKHGFNMDAIGYHHDLRPDNVLVSPETFVLADFGLGKFKPVEASSQTQWKTGGGDYLAPECSNENFDKQVVGRAIDIWAFGCLIIEIIVYLENGATGLKEFRKRRISPSRYEHWDDSSFYGIDGSLKSLVSEWLDLLIKDRSRPGPIKMLAYVSRKALKKLPQDRPKIYDVFADLTLISLKAHSITVYGYINRFMKQITEQNSNKMKLWFARERFAAIIYTTGLNDDKSFSLAFSDLSDRYDEYLGVLKTMVVFFYEIELKNQTTEFDTTHRPKTTMENYKHVGQSLENDICDFIESLWNLLPANEQKKAEGAWLHAMLKNQDIRYLDNVERAFKSEPSPIYEKGAALTMMKKIGLKMHQDIESNPSRMPKELIVSSSDVQRSPSLFRYHELGTFKRAHVLIERMKYSTGWERVPPGERAYIMSLKAQGFSERTRPAGMRTLTCVGAFEYNNGEEAGYGFLYRIPLREPTKDITSSTATLLQLIEKKCQPILSDKLRLAYVLAQFLQDFHSIEWLHKNFNSNNILFFNVEKKALETGAILSPKDIERPYIVGFHDSRLGGENSFTTARSDSPYQDYQHPEYAKSGRYQATYDYYSLGLVLFEIGLWCPLHGCTNERMGLIDIRQNIINFQVPYLGVAVGTVYRDVVHFCLSGGGKSTGDLDLDTLREFGEKVVEPLRELAEMNI